MSKVEPHPDFIKLSTCISFYLREKVENELQRLQQQSHHTRHIFRVGVTSGKPDGTVRIINLIAKQDTYPLPRVEDLFTKLSGGKLFSGTCISTD